MRLSAKRKGLHCWTREEFDAFCDEEQNLPRTCPFLGFSLIYTARLPSPQPHLRRHRASIDRINSSLGYEASNVLVVSWGWNIDHGSADYAQMIQAAQVIQEIAIENSHPRR